MAVVDCRLEIKGGQPLAYDDLPEFLKKYLKKRDFPDQASMAPLVQPGKSLLQIIMTMMGALDWRCKPTTCNRL